MIGCVWFWFCPGPCCQMLGLIAPRLGSSTRHLSKLACRMLLRKHWLDQSIRRVPLWRVEIWHAWAEWAVDHGSGQCNRGVSARSKHKVRPLPPVEIAPGAIAERNASPGECAASDIVKRVRCSVPCKGLAGCREEVASTVPGRGRRGATATTVPSMT